MASRASTYTFYYHPHYRISQFKRQAPKDIKGSLFTATYEHSSTHTMKNTGPNIRARKHQKHNHKNLLTTKKTKSKWRYLRTTLRNLRKRNECSMVLLPLWSSQVSGQQLRSNRHNGVPTQ